MQQITPQNTQIQSLHNIQKTDSLKTGTVLKPMPTDKVVLSAKANPDEKPVNMIISLVRSALNGDNPDKNPFKGATSKDWERFMEIANEASVTGMALDSAHKLPKGTIPAQFVVQMAEFAKEEEMKHLQQEKILGELSEKFSKCGAEMVQLKGVGLSMNYPVPQHRFGGDIDVFTRQKGTVTQEYSNTWDKINRMLVNEGYEVEDYKLKRHKHSEFMYDDVRIENHNYFVNKERMPQAKKIDDFLHKNLNPREQILPNGTKILVPSKKFNNVFLSHHAFQHFVFGGLDLHHLTDWATHIKKDGFEFPQELKGTQFEKFTYALTNLSNKYLGTDVKVPKDEKFEEVIFKKMLYPDPELVPENYNKVQTFLFKFNRVYKKAKLAKEYTGCPISKVILDSGLIKLVNPKAIFRK